MARPAAHAGVGRRALSPRPGGTRGRRRIADRTRALAGLQPRLHAGRGALALAARGRHLPPLPSYRRGSEPPCRRLRGAAQSGPLRRRRPPLGQGSARPRGGETTLLKVDAVEFETDTGAVAVTDFMPLPSTEDEVDVIRIVRGLRGEVPMRLEAVFRFDYG